MKDSFSNILTIKTKKFLNAGTDCRKKLLSHEFLSRTHPNKHPVDKFSLLRIHGETYGAVCAAPASFISDLDR